MKYDRLFRLEVAELLASFADDDEVPPRVCKGGEEAISDGVGDIMSSIPGSSSRSR